MRSGKARHTLEDVDWAKMKPAVRDRVSISAGPRLRTAMVLAILVDVLQMIVFPLFAEGGASPADDVIDLGMAALMTWLLGWHWEFLPSFMIKLVPGVDLAPLWSLAVANVYRKSRQRVVAMEAGPGGEPGQIPH